MQKVRGIFRAPAVTETKVFHFGHEGLESLPAVKEGDTLSFSTGSFSSFILSYTVDFSYEGYELSLPGGGFLRLCDLAETLGILSDEGQEGGYTSADIVNAAFSDPELIWVGRADGDTTLGTLRAMHALAACYSAELTEEDIAAVNASKLAAGEWVLVSNKPFQSAETLSITMADGSTFVIGVEDGQIRKTVISDSGETFVITVTYGENAGIPDGAELAVREILEGTEEFERCLRDSSAELDPENGVISFARFFDIQILKNKEKVEPAAPVQVSIRYADALDLGDADTLSVVHFAEDTRGTAPDVITDLRLNEAGTALVYEQPGFSVTGTVVQSPASAHTYALIIHHTDGNYYVVENDGTLTRLDTEDLTFENGAVSAVKMVNPISWTYTDIGAENYNIRHNTTAWAFDLGEGSSNTSLPTNYTVRFINVDVPEGYQDVNDTDINVWNEALQYNSETRRINHYDNYLGVASNPDGTLRIAGLSDYDGAAEIYFAEVQNVAGVSVQNHTVNHIDISVEGSAGIKVPLAYGPYKLVKLSDEDMARVDELSAEYIQQNNLGYRDEDLLVSETNKVTLSVEKEVPITENDIKKADISAYAIRNGEKVYLDDVYSVTGYSRNAPVEGVENPVAQVRMEGSFKVSDMEPAPFWCDDEDKANEWNYFEHDPVTGDYLDTGRSIRDVRKERPIYYTVAVNKRVPFTMTYKDTDGTVYVVLKEDGTPFRVEVDTSLSSTFSYWDEDNACPGLDLYTYGRDRWRNGEIRSNGDFFPPDSGLDAGPGMDFELGAPLSEANHDIVAVEVTKYIQGDFGTEVRTLSLRDGSDCEITVYQNDTALHEKTLSVGKDGIGMINDYDVTAGTYENPAYARISEDPDSVDDIVYGADGAKWLYVRSYVETEYVWRNYDHPSRHVSDTYTKEDGPYYSENEILGEYRSDYYGPGNGYGSHQAEGGYEWNGRYYDGNEYNRFLEFYVYNIYKRPGYLTITKDVTYNGHSPQTNAEKAAVAGTYTFTIYTDEACTTPYQTENDQGVLVPLTVELTIGTDGQPQTSSTIELPEGEYWIKETGSTNTLASVAGDNPAKVTITPNHTASEPLAQSFTNNVPAKSFSFTKIWRDPAESPLTWPDGKSITVTIRQDDAVYASYTISGEPTAGAEISADNDPQGEKPKLLVQTSAYTGYVFQLNDLPYGTGENGYTYTVSESGYPQGDFQAPKYFDATGALQAPGLTQTGDQGTICNDWIGYELPKTGGIGTEPFYLGGSVLILTGLLFRFRRRRRGERGNAYS